MVVHTVEETDQVTLTKIRRASRTQTLEKVEKMKVPEKVEITVPQKYEDKTELTLEDVLPAKEMKNLPAGKTEGYMVRKLIELKLKSSLEDDFIESSKTAIKKLRKFLNETAEGQMLFALRANRRIATKNKYL